MNLNNFTIKSQEAIQKGFLIAQAKNQQSVETAHILKGLLYSAENVTGFLFKKLGANTVIITQALDSQIESMPKVTGGEQFLSSTANKVLQQSISLSQKMGDQFVSVEHILLAMLDSKDFVSQLLKDAGVSKKEMELAILELRKGSKVDSQTAEDKFNSLNRFAMNLNERARSGKLDPVIGRDEEIRRILQILSRRTKNNPILLGEPGTGKTAIAEGLAHRIIHKKVPEPLEKAIIKSPNAIAITGISSARLRDVKILKLGGTEPTYDNIKAGKYQLYRPLYITYNPDSEKLANVKKFIRFTSSAEGRRIMRANG
ncbi:MAG: hypothetical protein L3J54_12720, partial [Draconibacterium sp.]|nr:hypothetical protein [Draconibacterium sp.]